MQCCGRQATHVDSTTKSGICLSNYWQSSCGNTYSKCSYACATQQSICSFCLHTNTDTTGPWGCSQRSYPSRIHAHVGRLRTSRMWAAYQVCMWTRHLHIRRYQMKSLIITCNALGLNVRTWDCASIVLSLISSELMVLVAQKASPSFSCSKICIRHCGWCISTCKNSNQCWWWKGSCKSTICWNRSYQGINTSISVLLFSHFVRIKHVRL